MKNRANVFLFSGQGSQYYHMGRELFDTDATFRKWMLSLDEVARAAAGRSVLAYIYDGQRTKADLFDDIAFSHPAIFMVEFALAQCLIARGTSPDYVVGVSLGSFAAAALAGCLAPDVALKALATQASMVTSVCKPGGMIAIFAASSLHQHPALAATSEIAAVNFPAHFVIAARQECLSGIETHLRREGVLFQRLPVSYAFHSRWIDDVRMPFVDFLKTIPLRPARIPVGCCAEVALLPELPVDYFWRIARKPIQFSQAIHHLEVGGPHRYIDVGPSGSLATFIKYLLPPQSASQALPTLSPFTRNLKHLDAITVKP